MTRPRRDSHPARDADASAQGSSHPCHLPIRGDRNPPAMLTISIIFALLVLLWGRIGVAHVDH
jgi:hypothetical protein